jgi:hypothetical protein
MLTLIALIIWVVVLATHGAAAMRSGAPWLLAAVSLLLTLLFPVLFAAGGDLYEPSGDGIITAAVRQASDDGPAVALMGLIALPTFYGVQIGLIVWAIKLLRATPAKRTSQATDAEVVFWQSMKDSSNVDDFAAYLEQFPDGVFAPLARNRVRTLGGGGEHNLDEASQTTKGSLPGPTTNAAPEELWPFLAGLTVLGLLAVFASLGIQSQGSNVAGVDQAQELELEQQDGGQTAIGPFQDCSDCPFMVPIPGQSIAIGRYEVTFAEWEACIEAGGCNGYVPSDQGWGRGRHPVIHVSWYDAQAYAQWLSNFTGRSYRLLSEAEWVYAASAGTARRFSWGDQDPVCAQYAPNGANFWDCSSYRRTLPVGSFEPNEFGLYDLHGNLTEWVQDCYDSSCSERVLKGGSFNYVLEGLESDFRDQSPPNIRGRVYGFRIAAEL